MFDENSAIQDHLFVGHSSANDDDDNRSTGEYDNDQHPSVSGSRVLRSTREKTTLQHIFKRLNRKATSPLCAVNRSVGSHGQVLSVAGLNLLMDELRTQLNRPSSSSSSSSLQQQQQQHSSHTTNNNDYLDDFDTDLHAVGPAEEEECDDFCIQQYIAPLDGLRYEVTCTRQHLLKNNNNDNENPNVLTVDVVPSNYANYYMYPGNYVPPTQFQQRKVAPPTADIRQRMVTTAMSILRHSEVAHDVRMVHVVFEMIVAVNPNAATSSAMLRRKNNPGGGGGGRRVEVYATGAAEVHWVMAPGGWRTLRAAPTVVRGQGPEARMEADIAYEASGFTDVVSNKGHRGHRGHRGKTAMRQSDSAPNLKPSLNVRRQARGLHGNGGPSLLPYQPTMHTASGSNLTVRKTFGPTSVKPTDVQSAGLLSSAFSNAWAQDIAPTPTLGAETQHLIHVGDNNGGIMGKGGLLTNIRVARDGGHDALHVQMSTELRKAQDRHGRQQEKIDMLVAKEEDHLSKIAGLEAAHGRLRKTLTTTESNLETHAMEAKQRIESLQSMLIATQHKLTEVSEERKDCGHVV